jgi:hypothetical protein
MDRRAHRHPCAPLCGEPDVTSSDLALEAPPARSRSRGTQGRRDRPDHRRHVDAGHGVPVVGRHPAAQARHCRLPGLRRAGGLQRFRLCAHGGRRHDQDRQRALCVGGRRRSVLAHPRFQRPHHLRAVRRRRRRRGAGGERKPGILASDLHADGKHVGILCVPGHVSGGKVLGTPLLHMDGQAVFKLAVRVLEEAARATLAKAGKTEADIDWLIPHQANIRIMEGTAKKLKLPREKLIVTVTTTATPRPPRFRWRWTKRCAAARSKRAKPSCSKAWAAASPGARCS